MIYINTSASIESINNINNIEEVLTSSNTVLTQIKINNISTEIAYTDAQALSTDNLKLISGRFFINDDIDEARRYIVIQDTLAIQLFATTDCINEELEISNEYYTVIGVVTYKSPINSLVDNEPKAYLPYSCSQNSLHSLQSTIKIICTQDTSYWVASVLKKYFSSTDIIILKNSTNSLINKLILCVYLMIIFLIILLLKILRQLCKALFISLHHLSHKYYLLENLKLHKKAFGLIFITLISICLILIATKYISFSLDPNMIPSTLASMKQILQHLENYINSHKYTFFPYKDMITFTIINIITYISILLILPATLYYEYQFYLICKRKITKGVSRNYK